MKVGRGLMREEIMNGEVMPETLMKESVVEDKAWDSLLSQKPTNVLT